jgi:hypothetical protein
LKHRQARGEYFASAICFLGRDLQMGSGRAEPAECFAALAGPWPSRLAAAKPKEREMEMTAAGKDRINTLEFALEMRQHSRAFRDEGFQPEEIQGLMAVTVALTLAGREDDVAITLGGEHDGAATLELQQFMYSYRDEIEQALLQAMTRLAIHEAGGDAALVS